MLKIITAAGLGLTAMLYLTAHMYGPACSCLSGAIGWLGWYTVTR
jgi:hypothetical protein